MALAIPPNDRKRVKVYELKENDWFDRGTGFCVGQIFGDEPRILVESEDHPDRILLETKISREDGYQKQQDTLIVWTDVNGTDMALSFQEAEGCAAIWEFVHHVQQQFAGLAAQDDSFSDDAFETVSNTITLPRPELRNLSEIEHLMRAAGATQIGRDALSKFIIRDEYILKLLPLVTVAEDLESLADLHRLCNIMKSLILLNDNAIVELVVSDHAINAVVGALEYDPEFPTHKANHRDYLNDRRRYKEVVPIKDPIILRKIRQAWRLQYLKDVVLARILDDPTFSVLNSLIFFNQVDIVQHLQENTAFLNELFGLFSPDNIDSKKKEDAVRFIHQCASITKTLQAPARANLYANFIHHGLFSVIDFAIKHPDPAMRTTGVDILVVLLDHDPIMVRGYMFKALNEKQVPLTDTLIELLHVETDLGVKNQLADALKVLLDPQMPLQELVNRIGPEFASKLRSHNSLSEQPVLYHFDQSSRKLFSPLKQLKSKNTIKVLSFQEASLYSHLVDILTFFIRQHVFRSQNFMHEESLVPRVAQLLTVSQKHVKLTALKFFRTLISLQDTFYTMHLTHNNTLELILNIVYESMPRDNLLNSACLELFEYVKRENIKPIIVHLVEKYRDKLKNITFVDTFQNIILRYDQMQGYGTGAEGTLFSQDESTAGTSPPRNIIPGGQQWHGARGMDAAEEEYFDTSDDEEEEEVGFLPVRLVPDNSRGKFTQLMGQYQQGKQASQPPGDERPSVVPNGAASPVVKSLVDYPDDDEDDEVMAFNNSNTNDNDQAQPQQRQRHAPSPSAPSSAQQSTSEHVDSPESSLLPSSVAAVSQRYAEKRRRQQDEDDDELVKLSTMTKRRSPSVSSVGSSGSTSNSSAGGGGLRSKKSGFLSSSSPEATRKDAHTPSGGSASAATPAGGARSASPGGSNTAAGATADKKKIAINLNMSSGMKVKLRNNESNKNGASTVPEEAAASSEAKLTHDVPDCDDNDGDAGDTAVT